MIKKIGFKNYKAFKEGEIELKPITILLGENSSGKSSLLQLIMLLTQTINYEHDYNSALKLNGKFVSLGEPDNIFNFRDTSKNIEITINLSKSYFLNSISQIYRTLTRNVQDTFFELRKLSEAFFEEQFLSEKDLEKLTKRTSVRSLFEEENSVEKLFQMLNICNNIQKKIKAIIEQYPDKFKETEENYRLQNALGFDTKKMKDALTILNSIARNRIQNFSINYTISFVNKNNNKSLNIDEIKLCNENEILLGYGVTKTGGKPKVFLESSFIDKQILEKYRVAFSKSLSISKLKLVSKARNNYRLISRRRNIENPVLMVFHRIFYEANEALELNFASQRINYVNPLRAFPKRYYFLDEANISTSLNTIDGDNLTEILKKNKKIKALVNKWLHKFNLSVDVEGLRDIIHKLKIKQHGFELDITDVGFGISQVLPVIVQGFLTKSNSLTIIEQPEIHLHPKMQADLADLFIDIVSSGHDEQSNKILLIETHSESLLKRLRRRMAESEKISNKDVAIYFIKNRKSSKSHSEISRIEISKTGAFEWPIEFYSTDIEDTTEYLKHQ